MSGTWSPQGAEPPPQRLARPAAVLVAAAGFVCYVGLVDPNRPGHYPSCPFLFVTRYLFGTGYYCPGCGSLRAVHALAHGHLLEAIDRNPLAVAFLPYLVAMFLSWTRRQVTGQPRRWLAPPWVIWGLLWVVISFWVLRNVPAFAWLAP